MSRNRSLEYGVVKVMTLRMAWCGGLLLAVGCGSPDPITADSGVDSGAKEAAADSSKDSSTDGKVPRATCAIPTEKTALFAYLKAGSYKSFAAESKVHPSAGPHGGNVRTYVGPELFASLGGTGPHPVCAGVVKEFYGSGTTTVTGYAASVKFQADSAGGSGWYFYETFDATNGSSPIEGDGPFVCTSCHLGGKDFVLTPFPLQ